MINQYIVFNTRYMMIIVQINVNFSYITVNIAFHTYLTKICIYLNCDITKRDQVRRVVNYENKRNK